MIKYCIFLIIITANLLYPIVIVEEKISKKIIYQWQNIEYSLTFTGNSGSFKAEGLNENAISDFEIINKRIESETIHKDNEETLTSKYKITYTLKPIRKGKLKIPQLEARYYSLEKENNLVPKEKPLKEYNIRVFSHWFVLIMIIQWIIIILIILFIYKFIKDQHKLNKKYFKPRIYN